MSQMGASSEDRITAAVPVAAETLAAKQAHDDLAKSLGVDTAGMEAEYRSQLKVRALECAHGYTPSALSGEEDIRKALVDKDCFTQADAALLKWIGLRRIGLLLAAAPLRPIPGKAPAMLLAADYISEISFAERAGVALLQSSKAYHVVDMTTGQAIRTAPVQSGSPITSLSPNGRLFVAGSGGAATVHESETGTVLATLPGVSSWQLYWVGDVGAIYPAGQGAELNFIDFTSGRESKIPMMVGNLDKIVALPGPARRYAVLGWGRHGVVELQPTPQGWNAVLVSESKSATGGWARNTSGLTSDQKYLYGTSSKLQLLELASMKLHTVTFDPMYVQHIAATPDPDHLVVSGFFKGAPGLGPKQFVYSISRRTLAEVNADTLLSTRFLYIPTLRKNAIVDRGKIVIVDAIPAAAPAPMSEQLERHAAELEAVAASRAAERMEMAMPAMDIDSARAELLARMQREGATLPPELAAIAARAKAAPSVRAAIGARVPPARSVPVPPLYPGPVGTLARKADVEAIGVYEGTASLASSATARGSSARTGTVHVRVRRSARPVILVLSAYDPVRWHIAIDPGATLAAVLSSGYHPSEITGAGNARVYKIGRHYAYKRSNEGFANLDNEVARWTGKRIGVFQGEYTGSSFSVGN
ncbi:MAG: hypothetical protein M3R16_03005 [Pseudomonadota bacterium]|nr:hypothetical protein [Pseudomonadota bacterium]